MVLVKMNGKVIAEFTGTSRFTGLTAMDEAKLYLSSLSKLFPEAKIEQ